MDLRVGVSAVVMNWLIMLYFIILFAERVQSIVRSIRDKDVKLFGSGFDSYVYLAVFFSCFIGSGECSVPAIIIYDGYERVSFH